MWGSQLPGIFEPTLLSRRVIVPKSVFLRAPHPKSEIRPTAEAVRRVLQLGWLGQIKIHGHRAQIHISADASEEILIYNRQGQQHKKELSAPMESEIRRLLTPTEGWNVIDAEWLKPEQKIYLFDVLRRDGQVLNRMTYPERYELLPRVYLSPHLQTLPLLKTEAACLEVLEKNDEHVEGLVFKSSTSRGFSDTSVIRCRTKRP